MARYLDKHLQDGEVVLYRAHLSPTPLFIKLGAIGLILSPIVGFVFGAFGLSMGFVSILLCFLLIVLVFARDLYALFGTDIIVTNLALHSKTGIVVVNDMREARLAKLDDTDIDMPTLLMRLFDYGDINIQTIGAQDFFYYKKVDNPHGLKRAINDAKRASRDGSDFQNVSRETF